MHIARPIAALALAGWIAAISAQTQAQADPQQVEVVAQPPSDTEQRRRDPVARSVYGREELDRHGDTSVSDVLKRLPGVNLSGGSPRLRGLGAGYTLILVNGEPAPPGFSLDNLSPSLVERIEVTKGPTAEHPAVAGSINVVLREPPRQRQRELRLGLGYQALQPVGSVHASWGDRSGALGHVLPLSIYQWRGSVAYATERLSKEPVGQQPQQLVAQGRDDFRGGGINFSPRLSWKLGELSTLNLQGLLQRHEYRNDAQALTRVEFGPPPVSVDDHYASHGHWQQLRASVQLLQRWTGGARLEIKLGGHAGGSASSSLGTGLDGSGQTTVVRSTEHINRDRSASLTGKFIAPLGQDHTLTLGWDLDQRQRREQRSVVQNGVDQLPRLEGQAFDARVRRDAAYLQDEWELAPRWSSALGLRGESIATRSDGLDSRLDSRAGVLSPVWHLNHRLGDSGRDLLRASLSRSFRAPEPGQLVARYSLNANQGRGLANTPIDADRSGNPALRPELATGLDIALETYFGAGGVASVSLFHRRIGGLIRQQLTLQPVPEAAFGPSAATMPPRWVSRPVNLGDARSTGVELELKGRAVELLPAAWAPDPGWSLRASLGVYRSSVAGIDGPDNRLESQQPWSATLGVDRVIAPATSGVLRWPLTLGASLAATPGYSTRQAPTQLLWSGRTRALDAYALLVFGPGLSLRLSAANLLVPDAASRTEVAESADFAAVAASRRQTLRSFNASLVMKF